MEVDDGRCLFLGQDLLVPDCCGKAMAFRRSEQAGLD